MEEERSLRRGCIRASKGPWKVRRATKDGKTSMKLRFPSERERQNNKERERNRRTMTRNIFAGLRAHGNFRLPKHADSNDLLIALCREAGWHVEEDGTIYKMHLARNKIDRCILDSLDNAYRTRQTRCVIRQSIAARNAILFEPARLKGLQHLGGNKSDGSRAEKASVVIVEPPSCGVPLAVEEEEEGGGYCKCEEHCTTVVNIPPQGCYVGQQFGHIIVADINTSSSGTLDLSLSL